MSIQPDKSRGLPANLIKIGGDTSQPYILTPVPYFNLSLPVVFWANQGGRMCLTPKTLRRHGLLCHTERIAAVVIDLHGDYIRDAAKAADAWEEEEIPVVARFVSQARRPKLKDMGGKMFMQPVSAYCPDGAEHLPTKLFVGAVKTFFHANNSAYVASGPHDAERQLRDLVVKYYHSDRHRFGFAAVDA